MARLFFLYLALFTALTLGAAPSLAQSASDDVIIDMSVLQAIDDYYASENVNTVTQPATYPPFPTHKPNTQKTEKPASSQIVAIAQTDLPPLPAHKPEHKASGKALKSGPNNMPAVAPTAVKTEIIVAAPIEEKNPSSTKADSAVKDIGSSLSPSLYFDDYGYVNLSPDKDDEILSENDVVKRKTPPKPQIINAEPVKTSSKTEFTLIYEAGAKQLTPDSQKTLGTQAAHFSKQPDDWRIQIHAYASSPDQSESSARRLSLSRALSLRKYFMDRKIPAERIDIKALGQNGGNNEKSDRSTDRPSDRVDIIFYDPNS